MQARRALNVVDDAHRLRMKEQARRVAAEETERQRQEEEALRAAAEEARKQEEAQRERARVEEQARRVAAEPPRPMTITDSRFEIGGRSNRAIRCDACGSWYRGNAVGTFWHTGAGVMPAAEFRRAAWERGEWDASWYCIECCAEYWECEEQEVMEYLGFSKRQSGKDQFMSARAVSASTGPANPPKARKPASIADTRFEKKRELRQTRCDQCNELKGGNEAGAFCHRQNMPPAGERKAAWECGDWDATWYCTECYMLYYNCSYGAVCDMLGFTGRAGKKARYAKGKA